MTKEARIIMIFINICIRLVLEPAGTWCIPTRCSCAPTCIGRNDSVGKWRWGIDFEVESVAKVSMFGISEQIRFEVSGWLSASNSPFCSVELAIVIIQLVRIVLNCHLLGLLDWKCCRVIRLLYYYGYSWSFIIPSSLVPSCESGTDNLHFMVLSYRCLQPISAFSGAVSRRMEEGLSSNKKWSCYWSYRRISKFLEEFLLKMSFYPVKELGCSIQGRNLRSYISGCLVACT